MVKAGPDTTGFVEIHLEKDMTMTQSKPGGNHIFGWCKIKSNGQVQLPPTALAEYGLDETPAIIFYIGSKQTGGLCITSRALLESSPLTNIVTDLPDLVNYTTPAGETVDYKGRSYGWLSLDDEGVMNMPEILLDKLHLKQGHKLLAIRSSEIAFTLGAKGPLLEVAEALPEKIATY